MNLQKKKNAIMNAVQSGGGRLPAEFQEVEYIRSSQANGTAYILLDYLPTDKETVKYKASFPYSGNGYIFGAASVDNNYRLVVGNANNSEYFGIFKNGSIPWTRVGTSLIYEAEISKKYIIINYLGTEETLVNTPIGTDTKNIKLSIFGRNTYLGVQNLCDRELYYFTALDENNQEIINLIPCYRKSDNVIGLYDTVNSYFYTNDGTGTFIKGPDV